MTAFEALVNRAGGIRYDIEQALCRAGILPGPPPDDGMISDALMILALQIALAQFLPQLHGFEIPRPPDEAP